MQTTSQNAATERPVALASTLAGLALCLFMVVPRTSPAVLALLAVIGGMAAGVAPFPALRRPALPVGLLLAFGTWAAISTIWAVDKSEAIGKALLVIAFVAAAWWGQAALTTARDDLLRRAGLAGLAMFGLGLAYLAFEEVSGHVAKRVLFYLLPFTRLSDKHMSIEGDVVDVAGYVTNRNMAAAMLALWPMLLIAWTVVAPKRRLAVVAALLVLAVATFTKSLHETSMIALAASGLVFLVARRWSGLALGLVAAGWIAATLLVVPLASWGYHKAELHRASWLPHSARHRIVLWGYTADQVWSRPVLGIGAASTKVLDARHGPTAAQVPGTSFQWRSGTHAHNIYLQTWYELGAVGALLLCAAGLSLLSAIRRMPPAVAPWAAATFTASAAMGATSWGMWQAWFLAAFAVSAVLLALAARLRLGEQRVPSLQ